MQLWGRNSTSTLSIYTHIFIANCSEPNIWPWLRVVFKFFCQTFQQLESFSNEKTPILICGANANFLALLISILDLIACLKFWDFIMANFPNSQLTLLNILYPDIEY